MRKKLLKIGFKLLPAFVRQYLMRSMIRVQDELDEGFVVKLAETSEEYEGAFRVLHDSYVEKGFCSPQPSGMRLILHHALPTTSVVIAKKGTRVVGTLTLVRDNKLKLPIEKEWNLSKLRVGARRIAEITCFAIDPAFRRANHGNVFFPLLRFMYEYATQYFGTDYLAVVIDPKDKDFYEGILFFKPVDNRVVDDYLGAPAIAQFLDLKKARARFKRAYGSKPNDLNLYRYFVDLHPKGVQFPKQESYVVNGPAMSADKVKHFFFEVSGLGREVTPEQLEKMLLHFPREIQERACRIEVELPAEIVSLDGSPIGKIQIKDISRTGIRVAWIPEHCSSLDQIYRIKTDEGSGVRLDVRVRLAWLKKGHGGGFEVVSGQLNWTRWVQELEIRMPSSAAVLRAFEGAA
ncbi:MAG: N-acyl amino acid synthase FeeM domain-containing protein [Bdellovibrionia bacterium]